VFSGFLAAVLLTGTASAVSFDIQGGNIIQVTNLELNFDQNEFDGFYTVDFVTDVGSDIFGTEPADFPFLLSEDRVAATTQLNHALSNAPIVPTGAGLVGAERYFVPALEMDLPFLPIIWASLKGQYFSATDTWEQCQGDDCLIGVSVLSPDDTATFATFTPEVIPVPAAVWLFGSALGLLGWMRRKKA
jgi:hypothetical protein